MIKSLRGLTTIRNRFHIQNEGSIIELDDCKAFSEESLILSEKVLEIIAKVMTKKYKPRIDHNDYVGDFCLPFNEHLNELEYNALEVELNF